MLASDKLAKLDEMTIRSVSRQGVTPEPLEQNFLAKGGSTSFDTSHVTMIVSEHNRRTRLWSVRVVQAVVT
jgi:hypothetical protein